MKATTNLNTIIPPVATEMMRPVDAEEVLLNDEESELHVDAEVDRGEEEDEVQVMQQKLCMYVDRATKRKRLSNRVMTKTRVRTRIR